MIDILAEASVLVATSKSVSGDKEEDALRGSNPRAISSPSGIPSPSVSGSRGSVPSCSSLRSGIPSPSVSSGFISSEGLFWGFVPSKYSCKSLTPPSSVSEAFHKVIHPSDDPLVKSILAYVKSHPVVFSK